MRSEGGARSHSQTKWVRLADTADYADLKAQRIFSVDGGWRTHRLNVFVVCTMYDDVR